MDPFGLGASEFSGCTFVDLCPMAVSLSYNMVIRVWGAGHFFGREITYTSEICRSSLHSSSLDAGH